MFLPHDVGLLLSQFVPHDNIAGVGKKVELSVTIQIDQFAGFHIARRVDFMFRPWLRRIAAWVLHPADSFSEIVACDNVRTTVAVHIERRVGKIFVVVRIGNTGRNITYLMLCPRWRFVPGISGEDVDFAIHVKVGGAASFIGRLIVDGMHLPCH